MAKARYAARIEVKNLRVEIWINSIPAHLIVPGEEFQPIALPLNEFLVVGRNTVRAVLHAAPLASRSTLPWPGEPEAAAYNGASSLSLRLALYPPDQTVLGGSAPTVAVINWQGAASPIPESVEKTFTVDSTGPWLWSSATPFPSLEAAIEAGAMDYLMKIHSMLGRRDYPAFVAESEIKLQEFAEAYGLALDRLRRDMLHVLEEHSDDPWSLRDLDPNQVDLRLVAGGRLVECLRRDRHPALEYVEANSTDTFFLPGMIGFSGGRWRLLR